MTNIFKFISIGLIISIAGCDYKAGGRQHDIGLKVRTNVNVFYIRKFAIEQDSDWKNKPPLNSEIINYPNQFFKIHDKLEGKYYVFEHSLIRVDSLLARKSNFSLSSIYDVNQRKWLTSNAELDTSSLINLTQYMKTVFLPQVINKYSYVNDSILYINNNKTIDFGIY